jgi:hypothetical protein
LLVALQRQEEQRLNGYEFTHASVRFLILIKITFALALQPLLVALQRQERQEEKRLRIFRLRLGLVLVLHIL